MDEITETMQETVHEHGSGESSRNVAILISILAAVLAVTEIGAKSSQNKYLAEHIAVSDDWAFYQARNLRATVRTAQAETLASLPNASDPAIQARIKEARDYAIRMREEPKDGMKALAEAARHREEERDHAGHRYHLYEYAAGALQLCIVFASVSVVTRIRTMAYVAGGLGAVAGLVSLGVGIGLL